MLEIPNHLAKTASLSVQPPAKNQFFISMIFFVWMTDYILQNNSIFFHHSAPPWLRNSCQNRQMCVPKTY